VASHRRPKQRAARCDRADYAAAAAVVSASGRNAAGEKPTKTRSSEGRLYEQAEQATRS